MFALLLPFDTALISGGSFAGEGFSHPYPRGSRRTVVKSLIGLPGYMRRLVTRHDWYPNPTWRFLTIACFMVTLLRILQREFWGWFLANI
jgi:hypothetical protein